jgi:hypothetical protein
MPRLQLRVYVDPGEAEIFVNVRLRDGSYYRMVAVVDSGAEVSMLPAYLQQTALYDVVGDGDIVVEQAGIARHFFSATQATVRLFLEDEFGTETNEFEAHVWFSDTTVFLLGFKDILDRAILHIDMRDSRSGWIDIDV